MKRFITAGAALAALAAALTMVFCVRGQYLLLRNETSGRVLYYTELGSGEGFSVSYIHSVNKSPVSEHYVISGSKIFLSELRYRAFGAGMPTDLQSGQSYRIDGEDMVIYGYDREMPYLCYNISRVTGHCLNIGDSSIPLSSLDIPGQPVLFSSVNCPRLFALLGIFPPDYNK